METELLSNPRYYIQKIIESRILGTGVHLTNPNKRKVCISYQQIPIIGIKAALTGFVNDICRTLLENLPIYPNLINSNLVEEALKRIAVTYPVDPNILLDKFEKIKKPEENWNYMDTPLKIGVVLNAFFEALDETMINFVDNYKEKNDLTKLLDRVDEKSPPINYGLEDFGFVFRARTYVWMYSIYRCNSAYTNVIKRIDKQLSKLYKEYFVEKKRVIYSEREKTKISLKEIPKSVKTKKSDSLEDVLLSDKYKTIERDLNSKDDSKVLSAIEAIQTQKMSDIKTKLEYLFNHSNPKIAETALDAYLSFDTS